MASWGFIRSTETPKIVIRLSKDEETIGRSLPEIKDFEELKYISRKHCIIRRLGSSSSSSETLSIEIEDLKTTNGTFLNGKKLDGKGPIREGDFVSFCGLKDTLKLFFHFGEPSAPVSSETTTSGVVSKDEEAPSSPVRSELVDSASTTPKKEDPASKAVEEHEKETSVKATETLIEEPAAIAPELAKVEDEPAKAEEVAAIAEPEIPSLSVAAPEEAPPAAAPEEAKEEVKVEEVTTKPDVLPEIAPEPGLITAPSSSSSSSSMESKPMTDVKDDAGLVIEEIKEPGTPTLAEPELAPITGKKRASPDASEDAPGAPPAKSLRALLETDSFEENISCAICSEIFHKCVSAIPCLHSFCSYCIGEWVKKKPTCPVCRVPVNTIKSDFFKNSMVEKIIRRDPSRARDPTIIASMDRDNFITSDPFILKKKHADDDEEDEDDYDEDEDDYDEENSDGESYPPVHFATTTTTTTPFGFLTTPFFSTGGVRCRECTVPRSADGFKCAPGSFHSTCSRCFLPFPTRVGIAPTRCSGCSVQTCDNYWGCTAASRMHLTPLRTIDLSGFTLKTSKLTRLNEIEIQITSDYLRAKSISMNQVRDSIIDYHSRGLFVSLLPSIHSGTMNADSPVCRACAESVIYHCLYEYRSRIAKTEFPPEIQSRSDCWYGIDCNTQFKNPDHAKRLNHACPKTR